MSEQEKQEGQKTVVSFVSGLLIGGLLVWAFGGSPKEDEVTVTDEAATSGEVTETEGDVTTDTTSTDTVAAAPEMVVGTGAIKVSNQAAGSVVNLESATYPTEEGWVAVRIYTEGKMGSFLGASRYSKEQGLVPTSIALLAPTVAGREYAVVFFSEDGNRDFNLDGDVQIEAGMSTFKAE